MSQSSAATSPPTSNPKTCAFFGATGGCANAALVLTLNAGHRVTALARRPSKLNDMLLAAGVPQSTITSNLHIVAGDAKDPTAVASVLTQQPIDLIISGLGMDALAKNPDATLCQDATRTILAVLKDTQSPTSTKAFFATISTTGISEKARDVPYLMMPLYHWLLQVPHADKKVMEELIEEAAREGVIGGWTAIRPAFLIDRDEAKGFERMEVGEEEKPAVGYTIPRKDVGLWIFEELVRGEMGDWNGRKPTLVAH